MNFKEGMRRVGVLLGLAGAVVGGLFAHGQVTQLWAIHSANREFETALGSPTVRSVTAALQKYRREPWNTFRSGEFLDYVPKDEMISRSAPKEDRVDVTVIQVDHGGVKYMTSDQAGLVQSIVLTTGEHLYQREAPALGAFLVPILYPLVGFLVPWGAIRAITWIGMGFFEPKAPVA